MNVIFGEFGDSEPLFNEIRGVSFHQPKQARRKQVKKQKKMKGDQPSSPEDKGDEEVNHPPATVPVSPCEPVCTPGPDQASPGCITCAKRRKKRFFATYLLELQEKDLAQLKLDLDVSRKKFHEQKEQWEEERTMIMMKMETETDIMVKIQKEEISELKLSLDQWKQGLRWSESDQMKMLTWQKETTSILQSQKQQISNLTLPLDEAKDKVEEQTRELQHQETTIIISTQISEAQKNLSIKDEKMKVKDLLVHKLKMNNEVLRADLREAQESDQHDQLLEVNANMSEMVKSKEQAYCSLEEQVKEKVILPESALVEPKNQLKAKDVELEEERSSHAKKKPRRKRIRSLKNKY